MNSINPVLVRDPITRLKSRIPFPVVQSGNVITYKTENAQTFSNSSFHFSFYTPNHKTIMNRYVLLKLKVRVTMTADAPGGPVFLVNSDSFRELPIASALETLQANINNQSFSINLSDVVHPFMKYNNFRNHRVSKLSTSPNMCDYFQKYKDGYGTMKNSLASYADSESLMPRGAFAPLGGQPVAPVLTNDSDTNYVAEYEITEPIFLSPFEFGDCEDKNGFIYIQSMSLTGNFTGNLFNRMWSRSSLSKALTNNGQIEILGASLLLKYITPNNITMLPKQVSYPYFNVVRYITNRTGAQLGPNESTVITLQNIQLHSIPHRIYIWVGRSKPTLEANVTNTDTYFQISSCNIQFNNHAALLSTASIEDLYQIAVRNGYVHNFQDYVGESYDSRSEPRSKALQGSVLCLCPGTDLQLAENEFPGMNGQFNLQVQLTVKNTSREDTIDWAANLAVINQGVMVIHESGITEAKIGPLTESMGLMAKQNPFMRYDKMNGLYGGSFLGSLMSQVLEGIQDVPDVYQGFRKGASEGFKELSKKAWKHAKKLPGLADEFSQEAEGVMSGLVPRFGPSGVGRGGKRMSRAQLLKRLR